MLKQFVEKYSTGTHNVRDWLRDFMMLRDHLNAEFERSKAAYANQLLENFDLTITFGDEASEETTTEEPTFPDVE